MPHWENDYIADKAIFWQEQARLDHRYLEVNTDPDDRIVWQKFSAEASERAREYLFELVGRGN